MSNHVCLDSKGRRYGGAPIRREGGSAQSIDYKAEAPETIDMSGALKKISKALLLRSETDLHEREGSLR